MFEKLKKEVGNLGKVEWRPLLSYVVDLHEKSVHPAEAPFVYPWEEIGPGYSYGPAFGHWDLTHALMDTLPVYPMHTKEQMINYLSMQQPDGMIPAVIYMHEPKPHYSIEVTHPPVWPVVVQQFFELQGDKEFLKHCLSALVRQIDWFEKTRKAEQGGFFYTDILNNHWESGVDEGIRFKNIATGPYACVDATAHVYWMYKFAARWTVIQGENSQEYLEKAQMLEKFMQERLFDEETGFFHDIWAVNQPQNRTMAYEGIWPLVVGAALPEQAKRVIDENLLNPQRFFSVHPIATVGVHDPHFELRCWRGPAWNSMTLWAAMGCMRYGRKDAARRLLESALDDSAIQFDNTGTVWEFYHPHGGNPLELQRKPHRKENTPFTDYLGHNPLIAMARLWEKTIE